MIIENNQGVRRILDAATETDSGAFFTDKRKRLRVWISDYGLALLRTGKAYATDTVSGPHGRRITTTTWRVVEESAHDQ